jgi:capsular polysaccharide biosynthesis protein
VPFPDFVRTLRRSWRLLLIGPAAAAVAAALLSLFVLPMRWDATSSLIMTLVKPSISLDPRVQTVSDEDLVRTSSSDDRGRRETLLGLVLSDDVIGQLWQEASGDLPANVQSVTDLKERLQPGARANVLNLTARGDTPAQAARLANLWAQVAEQRINALYSQVMQPPTAAAAQAAAAQKTYLEAEQALIVFLQSSPVDELQRQIDQKKSVLDTLQRQQVKALETRLQSRLDNLNKLDLLLANIKALQDQARADQAGSASAAALSSLLVQVSAFTTGAIIPVQLQIPIEQLRDAASPAQRLSNLEILAASLADLRRAWQTEAESLQTQVLHASDLLSREVAGQDLMTGVQAMQAQINVLQSDLETQTDTQRRLTDARDVAWESFTALARRAAEVSIASETTSTEVRLASTALPPSDHATPHTLLNVALAIVAGEILALAFVLLQAQAAMPGTGVTGASEGV